MQDSKDSTTQKQKKFSAYFAIVFALLAVLFISGAYTFHNAKGMSYLSNDSAACNNCHIMNDVYADYLKAPHSKKIKGEPRASCGDCHLPHNFIDKWIAKAESGVGHAYAFTFKLNDLPTNLSATEKTKKIVQQNCMNCHADYATHAINATTSRGIKDALTCTSCHVGVGHKQGF
ncbi:cytochrome c nitrite reductase small subunit [Helicobacter saguini]|uniref:Cytochrome c-type protein n=1 Tax=Helicobacter saguini TaxID=1548018 RepID=A0A347VRL6_9HELI|nr:cytochrome c nitrite reductase small subunit [Helicobacter saguini]MWV62856.1 cytochrome c nitrite reductase small subunit [Helicobacter saguini]MWV66473.1 cytochrome c nitrite reductase small subunit [Helicobacter saguini]MWV68823.1 cytochrome c nitrite reductase small subunit [Helicobacter saguini]MWV71622.1 cytochrome c nitrite reductase small subunit [Helicobacter saguini]TLD94427.1 cytochrome c nitrite reductase small subunit [Helicobacter saguini]